MCGSLVFLNRLIFCINRTGDFPGQGHDREHNYCYASGCILPAAGRRALSRRLHYAGHCCAAGWQIVQARGTGLPG